MSSSSDVRGLPVRVYVEGELVIDEYAGNYDFRLFYLCVSLISFVVYFLYVDRDLDVDITPAIGIESTDVATVVETAVDALFVCEHDVLTDAAFQTSRFVDRYFNHNVAYDNRDKLRCFIVTSRGVVAVDNHSITLQLVTHVDLNVSIIFPSYNV